MYSTDCRDSLQLRDVVSDEGPEGPDRGESSVAEGFGVFRRALWTSLAFLNVPKGFQDVFLITKSPGPKSHSLPLRCLGSSTKDHTRPRSTLHLGSSLSQPKSGLALYIAVYGFQKTSGEVYDSPRLAQVS